MSDESPWHSTPELRASAEHNLTDSRTKMQLYWAATEIERLKGWLERISREYDMQVSVIMPAIEEWQEDQTDE